MRDAFIGWQCRIRQHAFRTRGGRPSAGMRPRVLDADGNELADGVTVLLTEEEPAETVAQFRFIARQTHDPAARLQAVVALLSAAYFQSSRAFSDRMTALFLTESPLAEALLDAGECRLEFDQFSQRYSLPCAVEALAEDDPAFQMSYWHNSLFNPALPGKVQILAFTPDWRRARAAPPVSRR